MIDYQKSVVSRTVLAQDGDWVQLENGAGEYGEVDDPRGDGTYQI